VEPASPADLARWEADVILSDGGTVHLRPIRPDDAVRIESLHERLSRESRYLRFFSPMPHLSSSLLERFVTVDYVERMALVAVLGDEIIGVARYDTLPDNPSQAEVAFTVDDAHQGRGVGSVLLEHLAGVARDRGLSRFVAETLPTNARMLNVFRSAGFGDERHFGDGVVQVSFPIEPSATSLGVMHERERQAAAASVARFLRPRSVAVIGAGRERGSIGHEVFRNLLAAGFSGPVYPVNPSATSVASVRAYPSVTDISDEVDLAVVVVPAGQVDTVIDECAAKGVTSLIVMSGGYADAGAAGAAAQRVLAERARALGMRLLGPNSMGVVNADPAIRLNASLSRELPGPGRVGVMSQSGPVGVAILDEAGRRRLGVSTFVSAGNKADVSGNDLIQYWDDDPDTDVIVLYLESFGNPRTFARVARRLSRHKAVVAVKGGKGASARQVSGTPTRGSMGSEEVVDALFRHTGVIRVDTLAQLFDVADVVSRQPLPAGRRVGIVANAGGSGVLAADACEDAGLRVPALAEETREVLRRLTDGAVANPVTVGPTADADTHEQVVRAVLADPGVDAVLVCFLHPLATLPADLAQAVLRAAAGQPEAGHAKPVVANVLGADEVLAVFRDARDPVPVFRFPEAAAQALARAAELAEWRARPEGRVVIPPRVDAAAAAAVVGRVLAAHPDGSDLALTDVASVLAAYGIPFATTRPVTSAEAAAEAALALDPPLVVKAASPVSGHRDGRAALRFDLWTPDDAARAFRDVTEELAGLDAAFGGGVVVQSMAPNGVETVIEVHADPSFGPLLSFGTAGPMAEAYGDRTVRVLPLTDSDAEELIRSVRGAPLLFGWRGAPPADVASLADVLLRVSLLAGDRPEIAALTLGPILVSPGGAVAVDCRIRLSPYRSRPELALRRLS